MAIKVAGPAQETGGPGLSRVIGPGGAAWWLSAALGVAAAASSLLTFAVPAVLRGTAVMNGSARGTALVVLLAGVPALACSMLLAAAGVRPGLAAGYLAGLLLIAWIAVELLILRRYFFLQPVIAGIGAAEILLAWRWQRSGKIVTRVRDQRL
jgi:hypothetical protein